MGVLPLQFPEGVDDSTLSLSGEETFSINGLSDSVKPGQTLPLTIQRPDGSTESVDLILRIDTNIEIDYYRHRGILPYVLRDIIAAS